MRSLTASTTLAALIGITAVLLTFTVRTAAASDFAEVSDIAAGTAAAGLVARNLGAEIRRNADCSNRDNHVDGYYTWGTRFGRRSFAKAVGFCRTQVPPEVRGRGKQAVNDYFNGKDASHKIPHSRGGSDDPSNLVPEDGAKNRARGGEPMSPADEHAANAANRRAGRRAGLGRAGWGTGAAGGAIGAGLAAIPAAICGEPPKEIAKRSFWGAVVGVAVTVGGVALMAAVPVSAPWVAAGMKAGAVAGGAGVAYDSYRAATNPARCG